MALALAQPSDLLPEPLWVDVVFGIGGLAAVVAVIVLALKRRKR